MSYSPDEMVVRQYNELCRGVGHLFICFSRFEGALSSLLRLHLANHTKLDTYGSVALSSAIYGSMRYKTARDTIKRLMKLESTDADTVSFIGNVFAHVGHIEEFRNKIAHETVVPVHPDHLAGNDVWQVSDQSTTRDIRNPKIYVFPTELVFQAAQDLVTAGARLGGMVGTVLFKDLHIEPIPWLYKPSKLRLVNLENLRSGQSRPRPPQSSPQ